MRQVRPAKSAEAMVMQTQRFSSAISTAIISARSPASRQLCCEHRTPRGAYGTMPPVTLTIPRTPSLKLQFSGRLTLVATEVTTVRRHRSH